MIFFSNKGSPPPPPQQQHPPAIAVDRNNGDHHTSDGRLNHPQLHLEDNPRLRIHVEDSSDSNSDLESEGNYDSDEEDREDESQISLSSPSFVGEEEDTAQTEEELWELTVVQLKELLRQRPDTGEDEKEDQRIGCSNDNDDEEDLTEIKDPRRALEYFVSERKRKSTTAADRSPRERNRCNPTVQNPQEATRRAEGGRGGEDDRLRAIPNLVNRLLMEHYSSNDQHGCNNNARQNNGSNDATSAEAKGSGPTRKHKGKMTQLLLAVIVEFAEPHFARMARHQQRERSRKLLLQQRQKQESEEEKKRRGKNPPQSSENNDAALRDIRSSLFAFDERATSWATSCMKQLLRPPSAPSFPPSTAAPNDRDDGRTIHGNRFDPLDPGDDDDPNIPELDALLAASGPHDGLEMERRMQSALMQEINGWHFTVETKERSLFRDVGSGAHSKLNFCQPIVEHQT